MCKLWIGQPVLQFTIIGEQQQTFAVLIETSNRINSLHLYVVSQCAGYVRAAELAHHSIRFVEHKITIGQTLSPAALHPNKPTSGLLGTPTVLFYIGRPTFLAATLTGLLRLLLCSELLVNM